jgi:ribosomal protein L35AE/L33A
MESGDRVIFKDTATGKEHHGTVVRYKPRSAIVRFDDDGKEYQVALDRLRDEE